MPHAMGPSPGLQALILCGPGHSLDTFTSNPEDTPKALLPVANRPMVWYPLDWCYRMGISSIHLVSPPSSQKALEAALSQNPHLTSLPLPRATVLTSASITQTSGTAELLRTPEVQAVIKGDFMILPCDLVCEVPGDNFLNAWMIHQTSQQIGQSSGDFADQKDDQHDSMKAKGGLSVWYETSGFSTAEREETDFLLTAPLDEPCGLEPSKAFSNNLTQLAFSTTSATLKDISEENEESFPIRHSIMRKYARLKTLRSYRDAHIYIFPYWIKKLVKQNVGMDSISEDLIGGWAKATWQKGFEEKLGITKILDSSEHSMEHISINELDLEAAGSTAFNLTHANRDQMSNPDISEGSSRIAPTIPLILAYLQGSGQSVQLIQRVDTPALLMQVSLRLARLEPVDDLTRPSSPFAHPAKVAHQGGVARKSTTITKGDCLLAENVTIEERSVIKESVIGANCYIKTGVRISRCVLMDGVIVGEKCQLTGCILGRRSQIGRNCVLKDCEVQNGNVVRENTDTKGEKFMIFEGLDEDTDYDMNETCLEAAESSTDKD